MYNGKKTLFASYVHNVLEPTYSRSSLCYLFYSEKEWSFVAGLVGDDVITAALFSYCVGTFIHT